MARRTVKDSSHTVNSRLRNHQAFRWDHLPLYGGVSPPRDEALLFRQKGLKPFSPVRGPFGETSPRHQIIWLRNSLRSNSARQRGRIWCHGEAAPKAITSLAGSRFRTYEVCFSVVAHHPFNSRSREGGNPGWYFPKICRAKPR